MADFKKSVRGWKEFLKGDESKLTLPLLAGSAVSAGSIIAFGATPLAGGISVVASGAGLFGMIRNALKVERKQRGVFK